MSVSNHRIKEHETVHHLISRIAHKGTMWESAYHDIVVPTEFKNMRNELCYLHLNPVRAAITPEYDGYAWSSLTALIKSGSSLAEAGMRFVYGTDLTREEMLRLHFERMDEMLEETKRLKALEIARRRAAGYDLPCDSLTTEAEVEQAAAHLQRVQQALVEMQSEMMLTRGRKNRGLVIERMLLAAAELNPAANLSTLAAQLDLSVSTAHDRIRRLEEKGAIGKKPVDGTWIVKAELFPEKEV